MPEGKVILKIVTDIDYLHQPTKLWDGGDITGVVNSLFSILSGETFGLRYQAVGLAANQIGISLRIMVLRFDTMSTICIVNPKIVKRRGQKIGREECLSLPGIVRRIRRPTRVIVEGLNPMGEPVRYKFANLEARIACHEVDHLDGKLIIDY